MELTYNKKYIREDTISVSDDEQVYYTFKKNGTGTYNYYRLYKSTTSSYVVHFKYLIIDDTAVCFYNAVDYNDAHEYGYAGDNLVSTSWRMVVYFSKHLLITTGEELYICEDYLKNIPNFN